MNKLISILLPAFNEEDNILAVYAEIRKVLAGLQYRYEIIFINDGSTDNTQHRLQELSILDKNVCYIEFSRNFGHQSALKAGIDHANGDCVISMDCDLQHPPGLIKEMLQKWEEGYEIMWTKRKDDLKLSIFKRISSRFFYKICNWLSDVKVDDGCADFRLISSNVIDVIRELDETDIFLRGMINWVGFKKTIIEYQQQERLSGTSKYTLKNMFGLALKGITSFSISPLHFSIYLGMIMSLTSLIYLPYILYIYAKGDATSGWPSLMLTIIFFNGLTIFLIGILGIYIGKLFMQVKHRPEYIIRDSNLKKYLSLKSQKKSKSMMVIQY